MYYPLQVIVEVTQLLVNNIFYLSKQIITLINIYFCIGCLKEKRIM